MFYFGFVIFVFAMGKIIIHCDGGGANNKNRNLNINAWAYRIQYKDATKVDSGIIEHATSNIAELTAAIKALQSLRKFDIPVEVYSDSQYVVKGIAEWVWNWMKNNWIGSNGKKTANIQLWTDLVALDLRFTDIKWFHIKGHSGIEGNEYVDDLCTKTIKEYMEKNYGK